MEEEKLDIEIVETQEVQLWQKGKSPLSFLKCSNCYLRKDCLYCDPQRGSCLLKEIEEVDVTTGEGIINIVQQMLKIQAERVFRFVKIEEAESGFIDPAVTQELLVFVSLVEKLKRILSDDDYLVIRAKGKVSQGVLEKLFGDLEK